MSHAYLYLIDIIWIYMCFKIILFFIFLMINHKLYANDNCKDIKGIFFDLGDTLIESVGGGQFQLRSGAQKMINDLLLIDKRLGIITNVPNDWSIEDLEAILENPSFLDDFEIVVLSTQAPAPKPDPAIFNYSFSLLTNPPAIEQMAFVTEDLDHIANLEIDPTEGARAVGMIGIHLSDGISSPFTDYTVSTDDFQTIVNIADEHVFCNGFEL